jgi:hypothetical protein
MDVNTSNSVEQHTGADILRTNGSLPAVNGKESRVNFHEPATSSKPEGVSPPRDTNGSKLRDLQNEPLIPPTPVAEPTPVIIDEELDGDDLRLTINVKVNGRSLKIMNAQFNRIVPDGAQGKHRHVFFQTLASVLDEMRTTVAIKTNSKLPVEPFPKDGNKNWDGKDFVASDPGPVPSSLKIHDDPRIE